MNIFFIALILVIFGVAYFSFKKNVSSEKAKNTTPVTKPDKDKPVGREDLID